MTKERGLPFAGIALVLPIALLVLVQGGFYGLTTCVIGVVLCVVAGVLWLRKPRRGSKSPLVPILFFGLALCYALSALANGPSLTTLSEAGVWASVAGFSFLAATQDKARRGQSLCCLAWFGVATAIAGVLVAIGLLPIPGGIMGERLQFSFQYANAAAAWYGVCALLCLLSPQSRLRSFAALPIAALLLTESGGALLVFVIITAIIGIRLARNDAWDQLLMILAQALLAGILFLAVHVGIGIVADLVLVGVIVACVVLNKRRQSLVADISTRTASLALLAVLVVGMVLGAVLLRERIGEASASFGERLFMARDGLSLWATRPLLGIGPDNWQYLYQYIQTAPYYTAVIHSSLIQLVVDAGLLGLLCFGAASFFGVRALVRGSAKDQEPSSSWTRAELWAAVFLIAHSVIEFDLQFSSLAFVLALLLTNSSEPTLEVRGHAAKGLLVGLLCLLVLLPSSLVGLLCASSSTAIAVANARGDYDVCARLFEGNAFAQADVAAQGTYLEALYNQGAYAAVAEAFHSIPAPSDADATYATLACYKEGDLAQATTILAERLEAQTYNTEFCDTAVQLANIYGADPSLNARLNVAVERVRQNAAQYEGAN